MEHYASYSATVAILKKLGFSPTVDEPNCVFFDSPGKDGRYAIVRVQVYQCHKKYWCVDVDSGYRAPVVWATPGSPNTHYQDSFVSYLNQYFPGWNKA